MQQRTFDIFPPENFSLGKNNVNFTQDEVVKTPSGQGMPSCWQPQGTIDR